MPVPIGPSSRSALLIETDTEADDPMEILQPAQIRLRRAVVVAALGEPLGGDPSWFFESAKQNPFALAE
jgi:hypothetical protein